jgi:hypothetical protein
MKPDAYDVYLWYAEFGEILANTRITPQLKKLIVPLSSTG